MGEVRNAYILLVRGPEGRRPLGRPRSSWEDNIRMDLREIGWKVEGWIHLTEGRDHGWAPENMVRNLQLL
jgi:hypothetical protein